MPPGSEVSLLGSNVSENASSGYVWLWPVSVGCAFVALFILAESTSGLGAAPDIGFALLSVLIAGLGSAITAHRPGNRIAWLLEATAVVTVLAAGSSLIVGSDQPPFSALFWNYFGVVVYNTSVEVALYPVLLILFVFPDGHYPSRRWRWAGWLAGATAAAMFFVAAFSESVGRIYDPDDRYWNAVNPVGFLPTGADWFMVQLAVAVTSILSLGGIAALVVRYRRSGIVVREQIKWVAYAAGLAGVGLVVASSSTSEAVWTVVSIVIPGAIASAITIAVTRYRLFEIDRLISRTITYALVIGVLAAAFVGIVAVVTAVLPTQDSLAVAGSTLAVTALFNPLRRRIRLAVDRRFNRSSYRAAVISEQFLSRLREPNSIGAIADLWKHTVDRSLQPEASGVWLKPEASDTADPR